MQLNEFALLTDENIDPVVVDYLRKTGFDVLDVKEQGWSGRKDDELLTTATTQNRVIVTHDSDFGTLVFRMNTPPIGLAESGHPHSFNYTHRIDRPGFMPEQERLP